MKTYQGLTNLPASEAENVGKRARWTTYPNAGVGTHEGVIVAFVAAGESLTVAENLAVGLLAGPFARAAEYVTFDRYLVREGRGNSTRGKPYAPRWYAPRCSIVEVLP